MTLFFFLAGLAILVMGADLLVHGASRFGAAIGISPLVIGLTIVAFGTSSPEMAVSVKAALTNHPDLIIGTNLGSTIFNILFILGLCGIIAPLVVSQKLVWIEVPIMIGAHLLLLAFSFDGKIDRLGAFVLFAGIIIYTFFAIYQGRKESRMVAEEYATAFPQDPPKAKVLVMGRQLAFILVGLVLCVFGASWLLDSSVILARTLGVSELVIGMTIVAAGTSLPEVATSVMATIRGQRDIAIGNVVGSNIFNILGIVGVSGLIAPDGIAVAPSVLRFDLPVAIACCVACLPIFFTGHQISRWEGMLFFGYYLAYTTYMVLTAQEHDALPVFSHMMLWFVIPLTVVTLSIGLYQSLRKPKQ
jgi:cation:H+ antiporter